MKKTSKIDDGSTYEDASALNSSDPNYDSEEETGKEFIPEIQKFSIDPTAEPGKLSLVKFKRAIEPIIEEYFVSGDLDEFFRSVLELDSSAHHYEVIKRAINISLDKQNRERELVSKMISESYPEIFSTSVVSKGFERLFEIIEEVNKDVPGASDMIGAFVARCVADEVLSPSFLSDPVIVSLGGECIDYAKRLLSRDHVGARLERVWGPGDGRPVEELKVAIDQLLTEYLLSREILEASRCINELHVSHFHYEIVKRAVVLSLEKSEDDQLAVSTLFMHLANTKVFSSQQFVLGFQKIFTIMSDLVLDTPNALAIANKFVNMAIEEKLVPSDIWASLHGTEDTALGTK